MSGSFVSMLLFMLSSPAKQQNARSESNEITVQHGTLILLGISKTDITLAADTEHSSEALGSRKGANKITQVGKEGACTLNNAASLGNGADKADFSKVIKKWATDHPAATVREASPALQHKIMDEYDRYMASHTSLLKGPVTVSITCVGYEFGSPVVFPSEVHFANFARPYAASLPLELSRGLVGAFYPYGQLEVCNELISGTGPLLSRYRAQAIVQKYARLKSEKKTAEFTTEEFIQLSKACLEATESPSGRRFDPNSKYVGPPNDYVVISDKNGFRRLSIH